MLCKIFALYSPTHFCRRLASRLYRRLKVATHSHRASKSVSAIAIQKIDKEISQRELERLVSYPAKPFSAGALGHHRMSEGD